jgi:hypothetical protein
LRIYSLTPKGRCVADNPNSGDTKGLKIINFLRKRQNVAADDLIMEWAGVSHYDIDELAKRGYIQAI